MNLKSYYQYYSIFPLKGKYILTIFKVPGILGKLLGQKPERQRFIGTSTTWFSYPDHEKQSPEMDKILCEFWETALDKD